MALDTVVAYAEWASKPSMLAKLATQYGSYDTPLFSCSMATAAAQRISAKQIVALGLSHWMQMQMPIRIYGLKSCITLVNRKDIRRYVAVVGDRDK
jgi:hypothetical protein